MSLLYNELNDEYYCDNAYDEDDGVVIFRKHILNNVQQFMQIAIPVNLTDLSYGCLELFISNNKKEIYIYMPHNKRIYYTYPIGPTNCFNDLLNYIFENIQDIVEFGMKFQFELDAFDVIHYGHTTESFLNIPLDKLPILSRGAFIIK